MPDGDLDGWAPPLRLLGRCTMPRSPATLAGMLAALVSATAACTAPGSQDSGSSRGLEDRPPAAARSESQPPANDALVGPTPGLRGPLAPLRFGMTFAEASATGVPLLTGPGFIPEGIVYLPTLAPCGDTERLTMVRVDVPKAGLEERLERVWGPPQRDEDARCWFAEDTGIRACIDKGIPFGRAGFEPVQLEPFIDPAVLVAGSGREFAVTRGPLLGLPIAEVVARFVDACVDALWVDDDRHTKIVLPATRWGSETLLVLVRDDEHRVARSMLVAATWNDAERAALIAALQARFGPGEPGTRTEESGDKQTLTWPGEPEIRVAYRPGVVRLLVGPWGSEWSIEPPR
jgi:hypothetical protein